MLFWDYFAASISDCCTYFGIPLLCRNVSHQSPSDAAQYSRRTESQAWKL